MYITIVTAIMYYNSTTVRKILDILLVAELLIYIVKNISSFSRTKTIHLFTNP